MNVTTEELELLSYCVVYTRGSSPSLTKFEHDRLKQLMIGISKQLLQPEPHGITTAAVVQPLLPESFSGGKDIETITIAEAAEELEVEEMKVWGLIAKGKLKAVKRSGKTHVDKGTVERMLWT